MKIVGLIAEYNPFHNGHQYHIEMAKKITGADFVIVIMSGNFVQRGTPAIMPKHLRTESALCAGASVIIELPVFYATSSAESFALGAVSLLENLGCVDYLCFGSECGDISLLEKLAKIVFEEPEEYRKYLLENLRLGQAFPLARQTALKDYLKNDSYNEILEQPNNILGIEYLKALYKSGSRIKPFTITRQESGYHDASLRQNFSSASAIRKALSTSETMIPSELATQVPSACFSHLKQAQGIRYPVQTDDFSLLLKYRLLKETKESLTAYTDVSKELANRIYNQRNHFIDFEQFCNLLKTKELTYTRISRALLHILLSSKKQDFDSCCASGFHAYIRILGFRKDAASVLTLIKKSSTIPLITKLASDQKLSEPGTLMLKADIDASNLYESVITDKFKTPFINEYKHPIVRI